MNRDFTYHSFTKTLCSECEKLVDGKIIYNDDGVFILKNCPDCGEHRELLEKDAKYHLSKTRFDRSGTTSSTQTLFKQGCPYDCGLCPSHDQHTCIGLIEITTACNLECPMCYAKGSKDENLSLAQIEAMMDFYMKAENNKAEILQISGGEPTLHPDILNILKMAKDKGFRYVMLNTNGMRIAEDEAFVRNLGQLKGGFEVYLQFDGLSDSVYQAFRGMPLWAVKKKAVENLSRYSVPTTFVCTVREGINDHLVGEIIVYGMEAPCVRGVNFQPVAYYGNERPAANRTTLSGVLDCIENRTGKMILKSDFMPLPCNVERVAITYLLKHNGNFIPVTRSRDLSEFKDMIGNTFMCTIEDTIRDFKDGSTIFNLCPCCDLIGDIQKLLPKDFILKSKKEKMRFVDENTFRISVTSFLDKYNFDMKSMQKECVHIITPDLKRIPFSAYNMIHRYKGAAE